MGTFDSKALQMPSAHHGIMSSTLKHDDGNLLVREAQATAADASARLRIKELENELSHYRNKLEVLVQQRTEKLTRRISILEACNSNLSESYHCMRQMYRTLLENSKFQDGALPVEPLE
jgi:hypothetical protein